MKRIQLQAEIREKSGKEESRKLRKTGYVPGVLYSPRDKNNILLKIPEKEIFRFLSDKKHSHGIIDLEIKADGAKKLTRLAVIKDFQYDSLQKKINHFDFYGVALQEKVTLVIPIVLEGEPRGVKDGGILDISLREVEVECLPTDAPEAIVIDISEMGFNDVKTLEDVVLPKEVKLLTDISRVIASVVAPTREEEAVPEEEAEEAAEAAPEAADKAKDKEDKATEHKAKE